MDPPRQLRDEPREILPAAGRREGPHVLHPEITGELMNPPGPGGVLLIGKSEVEARSMLAFSLLIGNHFMAADHGPRSRAEVLELAAGWLLA